MHETLQPPGWPRPKGYANGIAASGRLIVTAGLVGWDTDARFPPTFVGQFEQLLKNILAVIAQGGARPDHIVRMTWYITSRAEYLAHAGEVGQIYRSLIGRHFPAMAVVEVSALMEAEAKIEIETLAVIP